MHRDEYGDDPFLEEDETDLVYDDGFAEAFALGEADDISSSKRHENDRRAAVRRDTGKIVSAASWPGGKHVQRTALKHRTQIEAAKKEAARQAKLAWEQWLVARILKHWPPSFGPLTEVLLAIIRTEWIRRAVELAGEKVGQASSVEDVIVITSRSLLSSALARVAQHTGMITPKQQAALTRIIDATFDAGEKVIKFNIGGGSGESEDWEVASDPLDDLEAIASADEDEFSWEASPPGKRGRARAARSASNGASPSDRRLAAEALRQCAKYLLRMERRLIEAGR